MKKILFIANTMRHIKLCHLGYLKLFKDNGYVVHVATNSDELLENCDNVIKIPITRNPFSFNNIKAWFNLQKLINKEKYDVISCHTPTGGVLGRLASIKARKKYNTKVIYTAHGFHFSKTSPKHYWLIYYPIEKILAKYTDCLITMNNEDYNIAKRKFKTDVYKINGIGFNKERLIDKNDIDLKKELGIKKQDFVMCYIAEISKRKRQKYLIKTLDKIDMKKEKIKLLLIGDVNIKGIDNWIKKSLNKDNIYYLGFKNNIKDYLEISDLVLSISRQEGLPLNVMEALYLNKLVIATNIRGNNDLIKDKNWLVSLNDKDELINKIMYFKNNLYLTKKVNTKEIIKDYEFNFVKKSVINIYNKYLDKKIK